MSSATRFLVALLLLSGILAGCSTTHAGGSPPLLIWYGTDDPVERIWSQQLVRSFAATHPRVSVRIVDYSFEDLNTKLKLALAGGNPPDLAYVTPRGPGIPAYVAAHRLLDLTQDAATLHWAARLRPGLLAQYNQPFAFLGARKGSVVAVPTALAAVGILYNQRLLGQLGLSVPRTLAQLETELARAKGAGYTPIGLGNADGWLGDDWYLTLANAIASPTAFAAEQRLSPHFSFRQPALSQAAGILQRWANRGYFTPDFGGLDAQEGADLFFQGKTLFQLVSSSENPQISQDQRRSGLPIGIFPFPREGKGGIMPVSGYLGWVIPRASRHPRAAVAFLDSLLSPATARFLQHQGVVPAQRQTLVRQGGSLEGDYVRALNSSQPGVYLDAAPVANLNATMEANVQLLLQGYEGPGFLVKSLEEVYASHGNGGSTARIDGEF
jgi:raffinose/stachyose/melibiose transport system substrate-binding protein